MLGVVVPVLVVVCERVQQRRCVRVGGGVQTDAATPNNTQQQVTGSADGRNMVKSNNAGSCWPTMLRPFAGGV